MSWTITSAYSGPKNAKRVQMAYRYQTSRPMLSEWEWGSRAWPTSTASCKDSRPDSKRVAEHGACHSSVCSPRCSLLPKFLRSSVPYNPNNRYTATPDRPNMGVVQEPLVLRGSAVCIRVGRLLCAHAVQIAKGSAHGISITPDAFCSFPVPCSPLLSFPLLSSFVRCRRASAIYTQGSSLVRTLCVIRKPKVKTKSTAHSSKTCRVRAVCSMP